MTDPADDSIEIVGERTLPTGLAFTVRLTGPPPRSIELRLHWADYNLWSPDGSDAPERVALAAAAVALERLGIDGLPPRLDAAILRRRWSEADGEVSRRLRPRGTVGG